MPTGKWTTPYGVNEPYALSGLRSVTNIPNTSLAPPPAVALTQDHIFVGNASNIATDVPMTGDASILASGAINVSTVSKTATASGTNTYTATLVPTPSAYVTKAVYTITFTNANTTAATLNLNSLGAKAIQYNQAALTGGEIPAGSTVGLLYDGTQFQIVGVIGSSAGTSTGLPSIKQSEFGGL